MNKEALNAAIEAVRSRDIATLDLAIKVGIEAYLAALAKPASSPAGGDVVEQALAMLDAESGDKLKTIWGVAAKSFADRIRALSQSTSAGRVGE